MSATDEYDRLAHEAAKRGFAASEARKRVWDAGDQEQSDWSIERLQEQAKDLTERAKEAQGAYLRAWYEREPADFEARQPKAEFE